MGPALRSDGRILVLAIACCLVLYHLSLSSVLGRAAATLGAQLADEDERGSDFKRLEALKASILLGRISALASAAIAAGGVVGIVRERLAPLRIFTLSSFISLGAECVCLIFIAVLAVSNTSTSSFSASLCEAMTSNADLAGSFDLFGWSVETCEERWQSLTTGLLGFVGAISLVRAWAAFRILGYYTALAKRLRRHPLSISTRLASEYSDTSSRDVPSPGGTKRFGHRIFLLPSPLEFQHAHGLDVPLLAVTPSSPLASFPPQPAPENPEQQYLVYAPVLMTAEQARQLNANEVVCQRARSRSHTASSPSPQTPADVSLLALVSDDGTNPVVSKGKLA